MIGRLKGVGVHRPVMEVAASEAALGELVIGVIVVLVLRPEKLALWKSVLRTSKQMK